MGMLLLPFLNTKADDADSSTSSTVESLDTALQPVVSCASVTQSDNNSIVGTADTNDTVDASGDCLVPQTSHISDGVDEDYSSDQTSVYVVRDGDSISDIAKMYDVSVDTIRWANDLKKGDKLKAGELLVILPVSGIQHTIEKGDTIKSLAKLYKADADDIAQYNGVAEDSILAIGNTIIIPDAEMSDEGGDTPAPDIAANVARGQNYYASSTLANDSGYFSPPISRLIGRLTQGLHSHNAVDIGAPKGTPIYAAAAGTVLFAKYGWNGGYGNLVIIDHTNGTQTYYAHQSKLVAYAGEGVDQGEVIGYVGSTGHSTGPHLHFEVRGAQNPALYWY
jgi:murein DD-endopeptidase MepM/ murein hydrolase activator NlpD